MTGEEIFDSRPAARGPEGITAAAEHPFRELVEGLDEALYRMSLPDGRYEYISPAASRVFGYSADVIQNTPLFIRHIIHPDDIAYFERQWDALQHGQVPRTYHYKILDASGAVRWIVQSNRGVFDQQGRMRAIEGLCRDVTAQKRAEQALRQARDEAVSAQNAAETANQSKNMFLANMNHELRTPLNIILGHCRSLRRADRARKDCERSLDIIEQSGEHLLTLIKDLLDLSTLTTGTIALTPHECDFRRFLRQITRMTRIQAHEKGLEFRATLDDPLPIIIMIDEKRLRQALLNLLNNAARFTEQGAVELEITARQRERQGGDETLLTHASRIMLHFSIHDTGIGIAPDQLDRIFLPFEQLRQKHQWHPGTGAGLAITQHLVQLMGGELQVTSRPGRGSRFWFAIPIDVLAWPNGPVCMAVETRAEELAAPKHCLPAPPPEVFQNISHLAHRGMLKCIDHYLDELEAATTEYAEFLARVRAYTEAFDDEALVNFLEQYKSS